jgi:hypothetical protein
MLREPCRDLTELDTEAAYLHLRVITTQKLDVAVREEAPEIARPVHPRARFAPKRIGKEALRR